MAGAKTTRSPAAGFDGVKVHLSWFLEIHVGATATSIELFGDVPGMGFGKDGKGVILYDNFATTLSGLTSRDVQDVASRALREDFRLIKTEWFVQLASTNHGDTILFGIAEASLTDAQIEECLEAVAVDSDDVPAIEQNARAVFPLDLAVTSYDNAAGDGAESGPVRGEKTIRWTFKDPSGWSYWFYNLSGATFGTGGINLLLKHYGVWVV